MFKGDKFKLTESWGEATFDVKNPVLCVMDVSTGQVNIDYNQYNQ